MIPVTREALNDGDRVLAWPEAFPVLDEFTYLFVAIMYAANEWLKVPSFVIKGGPFDMLDTWLQAMRNVDFLLAHGFPKAHEHRAKA